MTIPEGESSRLSLGQLAQIAEIVASLAVVVTLVFLVAEVRQNTRVTQATAYERRMDDLNRWRMLLATEPEISALYIEEMAEDIEGDMSVDQLRLGSFLTIQWSIYENAYFANRRELLGASEWQRFQVAMCSRYESDGDRWNAGPYQARRVLTDEFADFVEATCP